MTAAIFGIVTSITMIGPLLVDLSREFGVSLGHAGLLAAASAFPQALASPFAGIISDRFGRRPLIVFGIASIGMMAMAAAAAPSFAALVAARVLTGLLGCFGPTSLMAAVGDLFPAGRRALAMGWFNMGFSLAAIAGVPLLGAAGGWLGWRWAFALNGAGMLVLALAIQLGFPSSRGFASPSGVLATYREIWRVPRLASVLGANLVERSMFGIVTLYLPAFLMLQHALSAAGVAPFLSVVAVGTIAGNLCGGWLGDRLSRPAIFVVAQIVAGALGLLLFVLPLALVVAVTIAAALGFVNATSRPGFLAQSSELAPGHRGALFGLLALSNQIGMAGGAALGALVIELSGYTGMAAVAAAQGVLAAALAIPLLRARRPHR